MGSKVIVRQLSEDELNYVDGVILTMQKYNGNIEGFLTQKYTDLALIVQEISTSCGVKIAADLLAAFVDNVAEKVDHLEDLHTALTMRVELAKELQES